MRRHDSLAGNPKMKDQQQGRTWDKKPWVFLVLLPILIGIVMTLFDVLVEYVVAMPLEDEPPIVIVASLWSFFCRVALFSAGVLVLFSLIKSVVQKSGRARWSARWEWITGLSFRFPVTTRKQRVAVARTAAEQRRDLKRLKFDEGYAIRSAEVAAERAAVQTPVWEIRPNEQRGQFHYYLYNYGSRVTRAWLTAPGEHFDFEGFDPRFTDPFEGQHGGGFSGRYFSGQPTDRGMAEGVDFIIHWVDKNGDPQEEVKRVAPGLLKRSVPAEAGD